MRLVVVLGADDGTAVRHDLGTLPTITIDVLLAGARVMPSLFGLESSSQRAE